MNYPIDKQIAAVTQEIEKRKEVFPRLVDQGRMSPWLAETKLAEMAAVLGTLNAVKRHEEKGGRIG